MTDLEHPTTADDTGAIELFQRNRGLSIGLGIAFIVLACVIAYAPALRGEFLWDDDYHVSNNRLLESWGGLQQIWFDVFAGPKNYPLPQYYPMTHTSFWIDYRLWGLNPTGYHLTNVILHTLSALLVWLILRKLAVPGAWVAAALFAVHPLNVESVAWIAERKNVLSGFFFFASIYVYLRYAGVIAPPERPSEYLSLPAERDRVYGLAVVLFAFALLSKTVTATMPAVVLLIIWWKRGRVTASELLRLVPFFVIGIAAGLLTSYMEQHRVGAAGADWDYGIVSRALIAGRAFWFYLGKLVLPYPLIFNYPRWDPHDTRAVLWIYPIAAAALLVTLFALRERIGRGPVTAMLYYAGTLFPAMGFVNVFPHRYSFVADHFAYLSIVGPIALAVAVITWSCVRYMPRDVFASGAPAASAAGVLLVFFLLSLFRARVYAGPEALWADTLRKNKNSWFAANNYGVWLRDQKDPPDLEKAEVWFDWVMRKYPDHPESRYNMGVIAQMRGDRTAERRYYEEALRLRPNYAPALLRLGNVLEEDGQFAESERMYRRIIEMNPRDYRAHMALGFVIERQKDLEGKKEYDKAIEAYERASDVSPQSPWPFIQIGGIRIKQNRFEEAMRYMAEAGRRDPRNPTVPNSVGFMFYASGYLPEARVMFERALALNPRMVDAITNLGLVAARAGFPDEARRYFERALEINPQYARARQSLTDLNEGRLKPATTQSAAQPAAAPPAR